MATQNSTTTYMVKTIKQELTASVYGREVPLSLKDAADGCIGVSLWFDTIEHALDYADNDPGLISTATYAHRLMSADIQVELGGRAPERSK